MYYPNTQKIPHNPQEHLEYELMETLQLLNFCKFEARGLGLGTVFINIILLCIWTFGTNPLKIPQNLQNTLSVSMNSDSSPLYNYWIDQRQYSAFGNISIFFLLFLHFFSIFRCLLGERWWSLLSRPQSCHFFGWWNQEQFLKSNLLHSNYFINTTFFGPECAYKLGVYKKKWVYCSYFSRNLSLRYVLSF